MRLKGKVGADDKTLELYIANGRLASRPGVVLSQVCDPGGEDLRVAPGLIDIQINGYDGVDFNDPNTKADQIVAAARNLWRTGVTGFCPTIITESYEHISKCVSNLVRAADQTPEFARAMIGIHVEGPFISPEDGPRGAHPKRHARAPDWIEFQRWQDAARGRIRIVTLSPEWPGAIDFIERAAASGVVVAIGHTAAAPAQIADAARAGARLSTHLGNGSHAKIDRHPNYIWEQLANDDLWASFIVDGHHLPPSVVKCFLRSKGVARSILVTDAIAAASKPAGRYRLGNVEVEVTPSRRVNLPGSPYLAGSVLEMHEAVAKTVQYSDATLDDALRMASANPAELLGVADQFGSVEIGRRADLILFRWDEENSTLDVAATIVNGETVYVDQNGER
ncbi:MAG TPA: N-acetylglucosamine-6-phosphate deacetylase [Blastocatellia bacterium]|jgi:N-acetylglucosamine-6-phosphate deacetylase|nr:N-acetylglucosamine-6-phosphate deacetylase [Blastocatellia bacterium]